MIHDPDLEPTPPETPVDLSWLEELNAEQRRAVEHGDGPLLVVAGAGSGKTRTLAYRVAYLISRGVNPGRILLLTFTRRAAEEMLKRAAGVCARSAALTGRVWGGTFHSMANRILRIHAHAAGLSPDFTVMDQADAEDLMNVVRHDLGMGKQDKRFPRKGTCLAIYSRRVNGTEDLDFVLDHFYPWCATWRDDLKRMFRTYVERKQKLNVLDYDDLLLYWAQLLENEEVAREIGGRFDHVLVDEYQDTNKVQADILRGMRRTNPNIMVVGDDAQSIYSFRAATIRNILDFPKQFPGTTVVTLEQNYRSVPPILETTNRLIAHSKERYTKDLWSSRPPGRKPWLVTCRDEAEQDQYVVSRILQHREEGIALRQQAVLFRAGHLSDSLELELTRRQIPYHKYGGLRFLEAAHVKDLVSFLRVAENPRDEMAWFRVLQLIDGVGPATASKAVGQIVTAVSKVDALRAYEPPAAAREGFKLLADMLADLDTLGARHPAAHVERIRRYYDPVLARHYDNATLRQRDLEHIEQIAANYTSRRQFLTDLTLDPPNSTSDLAGPPSRDEDWLVLSTIHSAKGCEWDAVYVIHAADGFLPSDMATGREEEIDEERRLTYVAMTRAKDFLYITWPLRYYHRWSSFTDRHSYAQLCRFLTEDVRATCDLQNAGVSYGEGFDSVAPPRPGPQQSRIRDMWD